MRARTRLVRHTTEKSYQVDRLDHLLMLSFRSIARVASRVERAKNLLGRPISCSIKTNEVKNVAKLLVIRAISMKVLIKVKTLSLQVIKKCSHHPSHLNLLHQRKRIIITRCRISTRYGQRDNLKFSITFRHPNVTSSTELKLAVKHIVWPACRT